jgi:hypothetical protein
MYTQSFFKQILIVVSVLLFASCDKDYNEIGADLIDQNNIEFTTYSSNVIAYNQKIEPIESSNLPVNPLGIYNNPAFGQTIANFATQVQLATVNPIIDPDLNQNVLDVILNIPYFVDASQTKTKDGKGFTYELDSIYGNASSKFKLSIYESGYEMEILNANDFLKDNQKYYTNQNSLFDNIKIGNRLNDSIAISQNDNFFFDEKQHEIVTKTSTNPDVTTTSYLAPSMRLKLNKTFFENKILKAPSGKLINNEVFIKYFKGLYFKVEKIEGNEGQLAMLDFSKGTITINYKEDKITTTNGVTTRTRVDKSIVLNLSGNRVSLLEQSNQNTDYSAAINAVNETEGDERLYLKGGEGSLSVIKLFDTPGELATLRDNNWLVNEANLKFYIDASKMLNSPEPQRIYLYDLTNNKPIADYSISNSKKGSIIYDGRLVKQQIVDGRGLYYKIRITNHIRALLKKDSKLENVQLGVVVTEDINNSNSNTFKNQAGIIKKAPAASVMNPLGTILYGTGTNVPEDKKLKLEIYYTKPN